MPQLITLLVFLCAGYNDLATDITISHSQSVAIIGITAVSAVTSDLSLTNEFVEFTQVPSINPVEGKKPDHVKMIHGFPTGFPPM